MKPLRVCAGVDSVRHASTLERIDVGMGQHDRDCLVHRLRIEIVVIGNKLDDLPSRFQDPLVKRVRLAAVRTGLKNTDDGAGAVSDSPSHASPVDCNFTLQLVIHTQSPKGV